MKFFSKTEHFSKNLLSKNLKLRAIFNVLDMTDLCILCKMVALFSPTSSFQNINNDVILFYLLARIFLSQFPH